MKMLYVEVKSVKKRGQLEREGIEEEDEGRVGVKACQEMKRVERVEK